VNTDATFYVVNSGRSARWLKVKTPKTPAVKHEAKEDWGR
jgi:hypothetical protein